MNSTVDHKSKPFSPSTYWIKLKQTAITAGRDVVEKSLWLYYAANRPDIPNWAKATVYGALAYFIMPMDTIPDFIPGAGYTDDLAALAAAVTAISQYIDDNVKGKASAKFRQWFGE